MRKEDCMNKELGTWFHVIILVWEWFAIINPLAQVQAAEFNDATLR